MKLTRNQIVIAGLVVFLVIVIGAVAFFNLRKPNTASQVKLTVWGTDDQKAMMDTIGVYEGTNQGAQIKYVQIDPSQYATKVLSALAAGTGPDAFEISNRDLAQWQNVIAPMPAVNAEQFSLVTLQNDFPTVVGDDFVSGGSIYALPLSLDTLAMIYNKDLVDSAGIATLPATWDDFDTDVARLRAVNAQGQITQAGAAIGGSTASIANAPDILYLLMLQNGTQMTTPDFSEATFANDVNGATPGQAAFNFYLQFSSAGSPYYTWNDGLGDAEQSFIQGKTAIIFDYGASLNDIKTKAPFLNFGVAPVPQPTGATVSVSYPNYEGLVVARYGQVASAWDFVIGLTTAEAGAKIYSSDTGAPPALRSVIAENVNDPILSVFGAQALTARSWHEADPVDIDAAFNAAIASVLAGASDSTKALQTAQSSVDTIISSQ